MKNPLALTFVLMLCLLAGAASAKADTILGQTSDNQEAVLPTANTHELNAAGLLQFGTGNTYDLQASYGDYQSSKLEVGGSLTTTHSNGSDTVFALGAFGNFLGKTDRTVQYSAILVPYAGAFLGDISKGSKSGIGIGIQGGGKYFVNGSTALTAEYQYRTSSAVSFSALVLGISTFFH